MNQSDVKQRRKANDDENNHERGDSSSSSSSTSSHRQTKNHHEEEEEKEQSSSNNSMLLCTFAATGATPVFQSIYICHSCSQQNLCSVDNHANNNDHDDDDGKALPLCICENCAQECHEALGHDVEYYGTGPSYCDCFSFYRDVKGCHHHHHHHHGGDGRSRNGLNNGQSCVLHDASIKVAEKLGISKQGLGVNYNLETQNDKDVYSTTGLYNFPFLAQAYTLPLLSQPAVHHGGTFVCDVLIEQALELIRHTNDTHWLSISNNSNSNGHDHDDSSTAKDALQQHQKQTLCDLERVAYGIFQRHIRAFSLEDKLGPDGGAEWWVQVKKTPLSSNSRSCGGDSSPNKEKQKTEAIDLHYDKDEELAETFDLGSFPTLSTVTYLSGRMLVNEQGEKVSAAPTLVFPHTYEMPGEGPIGRGYSENEDESDGHDIQYDDEQLLKSLPPTPPQVLISHPCLGKHLVFDGRLLHGAPSNKLLRKSSSEWTEDDVEHCSKRGIRVTFLVNIWLTRRPSKVKVLSMEIRNKIMARSTSVASILPLGQDDDDLFHLDMIELDIGTIHIKEGKGSMNERVQLPFVSTGATWIDDDDVAVVVDGDDDHEGPHDNDERLESGLVVSMVPPPSDYQEDSVFVTYDCGGLEPRLEYIHMYL
mmetsp:Transcript_6512/g.12268  ORF Transcript_6512/g.12268 Transcript_6512/m.12268 type:complete len:647 (-) Transcript_6512:28-1968(-)